MKVGIRRAIGAIRLATGGLILVGCILLGGRTVGAGLTPRVIAVSPDQTTPAATASVESTATGTPAPNLLPYVSRSHVIYTPTPTLTPTVTPTASNTPKPWIAHVYVGNNTASEMCYEVYGTGIGRTCFPPGEHLYGRFQAGVYLFRVELRCGSAELPWQYDGGRFVHDFWCPAPPE